MHTILIVDYGSQYTQLIARRIRELNIYSQVIPYPQLENFRNFENIKGIILSGSPFSVSKINLPKFQDFVFYDKLPVLGVCFGAQYIAHSLGGKVSSSDKHEYGKAYIKTTAKDIIFDGINQEASQVWMSHGDTITDLPKNAKNIATSNNIKNAAYKLTENQQHIYGIQFHPEVYHSLEGSKILANFALKICGCNQSWTPDNFVKSSIESLKNQLGDDNVVLGLSGGVDSSVAALLLKEAIGDRLHCIFVDNGLLRLNEFKDVLLSYKNLGLNIKGVDYTDLFLNKLKNVTDPELKRKAIGNTFIDVFEKECLSLDDIKWLGQGTIYPDVIESISVHGPSATIKSHHNVGGLPEKMNLKVVEPLRMLFKDEVRKVGAALNLPSHILNRHPFPGPGLAIRILGDITKEKISILQQADDIFISKLKKEGYYDKVWQAGAIFLPVQSVGVMGDERTYDHVICLRAVNSVDGMTAEWSELSYEFLAQVSNQIINEVKGVNRVVYDISTKPPATIEWE